MVFIFDIDDTLYKRSKPFIEACNERFKSFDMDFKAFYKVREKYSEASLEASETGSMSMEDMYDYRLNSALKEFGYHISRSEVLAFEKSYRHFMTHITLDKPFDTLLPYLKEKGIKMGILTNGHSDNQKAKAHALKMERYIPEVYWVASGDVGGIIKPRIEIFRYMEKIMHIENEEIWMIGDNYKSDIMGAKNAGWHTIWYDHAHKRNESSISDIIVDDPESLEKAIRNLAEK